MLTGMNQLRALQDSAVLVGRLLLSLIFVVEGWLKVADYSGTVGYMQAHGVPGVLLPLVILTELGGGLLVAFGLFTRLAAIALAGFCLLTALLFHMTPDQAVHFYKNLAMAGGFLTLAAHGAGVWSLDGWRAERRTADR
jgi:putative oxidoreductase